MFGVFFDELALQGRPSIIGQNYFKNIMRIIFAVFFEELALPGIFVLVFLGVSQNIP